MNRTCLLIIAFLSVELGALAFAETAIKEQPVVVMLDHAPCGFIYKVNSQVLKGDLLGVLGQIRTQDRTKGTQRPAVLLIHEDAKIAMMVNALGIMNKAGFVHPRVFYFDKHKDRMYEITPSSVVTPFSAEGIIPGT